jgi:hypothetical protein
MQGGISAFGQVLGYRWVMKKPRPQVPVGRQIVAAIAVPKLRGTGRIPELYEP